MALIPINEQLAVPITQIMWQAKGDVEEALLIAAAYGYGCACRDLEEVQSKTKIIAKKRLS